jgi:hypothetical protein
LQASEPTYLGALLLVSARPKERLIIECTSRMVARVNNKYLIENLKKLAIGITSNP